MKIQLLKILPKDEIQSVMICGKWHMIVEGTFSISADNTAAQFTLVSSCGWCIVEPDMINAVSSSVLNEVGK